MKTKPAKKCKIAPEDFLCFYAVRVLNREMAKNAYSGV
jgi:hypothetical protein